MNKIKLYNKSSTGKIKVLEYELKGNKVISRWGYIDNEQNWQETIDEIKVGKNLGKSNEQSPEDCAKFEFERKIRLKSEQGYTQNIKDLSKVQEIINWETGYIADKFCPPKPACSIEQEDIEKLCNAGSAIFEKKSNGQRHFICRYKNGTKIYSRRIEDRTEKFPKQVEIFNKLLEPGDIIDTECVTNDDDPDKIKEIVGSKPEKAIQRQKEKGWAEFKVFDWLYSAFKPFEQIYSVRLAKINKYIKDENNLISPIEVISRNTQPKIPEGYEGLVLWDGNGIGTKEIRIDGKESRKAGCFKIKMMETVDLVCYSWTTGKGKLNNNVATLKLGAYDKDGKLQHVCESGSGLTDALREEILQLSPLNNFKEFTVEIKYEEKIKKSGSLRLPILLRLRPDKPTKECLLEDIK